MAGKKGRKINVPLNKRIELIGQRFGKLVVDRVGYTPEGKQRRTHWICKCDCGNEINIKEASLLLPDKPANGCGCLKGQRFRTQSPEVALLRDKWSKAQVWRYAQYRYSAAKRGHEFKLTEGEFEEIAKRDCYYCSALPKNTARMPKRDKLTKRNIPFSYNGLDRVDNNLGYTIGNVVACCADCNRAKRALTQEEFFDLIRRIYEHHNLGQEQWKQSKPSQRNSSSESTQLELLKN